MLGAAVAGLYLTTSMTKEVPSMEGVNEVVARLKFIGRIQVGEKLSVTSMKAYQNTWLATFFRSLNPKDNRQETLRFFRSTIDEVFRILNIYVKSTRQSDKELCVDIVNDLEFAAKGGIRNTLATYEDDSKFRCDLEVLINFIQRNVQEMKTTYTWLEQQADVGNAVNGIYHTTSEDDLP